ncbi:MAG: type II secretion system inner membrane protein GspF [bacterium]
MAVFVYKAADKAGNIVTGTMEAKDRSSVINRLQASAYFPIKIEQGAATRASLSERVRGKRLFQRVSNNEILGFTQQLATLTGSAIPLDRSLSTLKQLSTNEKLASIIDDVHKNVHGGSLFADALAQHPKYFSKLYVNMVKAGEAGGVLEAVLARLAEFLESSHDLRENIKSALIYPILLTVVSGIAVTVLLVFVVPKFRVIFADMGKSLPLLTQMLLGFSQFLVDYWWLLAGVALVLIMSVRRYITTPRGRWNWDRLKLKMPMFGGLVQKIEIARFARTFGTLIQSGVPILQALNIVKDIVGNTVISRAISSVQSSLKEGEKISEPLKQSGVFPPLAVHMIDVGEETGQLENMLFKVADAFEVDVRTSVKRMVGLLEPLLILIMGGIVAVIVIGMLLAIFSINEIPF